MFLSHWLVYAAFSVKCICEKCRVFNLLRVFNFSVYAIINFNLILCIACPEKSARKRQKAMRFIVASCCRNASIFSSFRSISLVGESERKLLKEIVKQAKNPVKSRIVAPEIINKFKNKLRGFEEDVQEILKQEKEDKEVNNLLKTAKYLVQKKCVIWRPTIEIMKSTR